MQKKNFSLLCLVSPSLPFILFYCNNAMVKYCICTVARWVANTTQSVESFPQCWRSVRKALRTVDSVTVIIWISPLRFPHLQAVLLVTGRLCPSVCTMLDTVWSMCCRDSSELLRVATRKSRISFAKCASTSPAPCLPGALHITVPACTSS